eukprot:GHVQ01038267.1.p1 GENE.GHVQ01038267.1~~GHVQ01038267.1.p1  ORF type:complete len:501 (+),score=41.36 GHVQ01038267.1:6269-7771(+)
MESKRISNSSHGMECLRALVRSQSTRSSTTNTCTGTIQQQSGRLNNSSTSYCSVERDDSESVYNAVSFFGPLNSQGLSGWVFAENCSNDILLDECLASPVTLPLDDSYNSREGSNFPLSESAVRRLVDTSSPETEVFLVPGAPAQQLLSQGSSEETRPRGSQQTDPDKSATKEYPTTKMTETGVAEVSEAGSIETHWGDIVESKAACSEQHVESVDSSVRSIFTTPLLRYAKRRMYAVDVNGEHLHDYFHVQHVNGLSILGLARSHAVFKGLSPVGPAASNGSRSSDLVVTFSGSVQKNTTSGKRKRGALVLGPTTKIGSVTRCVRRGSDSDVIASRLADVPLVDSNSTDTFPLLACIKGDLVDFNDRLASDPAPLYSYIEEESWLIVCMPRGHKMLHPAGKSVRWINDEEYRELRAGDIRNSMKTAFPLHGAGPVAESSLASSIVNQETTREEPPVAFRKLIDISGGSASTGTLDGFPLSTASSNNSTKKPKLSHNPLL